MIIRTVRFTIKPQLEPTFLMHARRTIAAQIGHVEGLMRMEMGVRLDGPRSTFIGVSVWRDMPALRAFLGDNFDRPRLWDPEGEWIESATIEHYEGIA